MKTMKALCLVSLFLATIMMSTSTALSTESEGSKISGFVIGEVWHDTFKILFMQDPLFTHSPYPLPSHLTDPDKRKLDRVYYPRTGKILMDSYDLIVFHDARIQHFTSRQLHDLDYASREAGMTSMMMRGSFMWDWVWEVTILSDSAPISRHDNNRYVGHRVVFGRERDPVFLPFLEFGIEKVVGNAVAEMDVKQGATIWGDTEPLNQPWLVSWKPGGENAGIQWVLNQCQDWWTEKNNPYVPDMATNMILYSMDRPLISDILARREARRLFASLQSQKSLILSVIEWADTFGANTLSLSERLTDLEDGMEGAISDYLDQDYAATVLFLESTGPRISEISRDAVRLKDEVLFWVYTSEWLVVTSAGIISGVVVWSLMIRRRMYRIIETTKLSKEETFSRR